MWAARSASCLPASVGDRRREVRFSSRAPSRRSSRLTAFDTVAFDSCRSAAARANERICNTLAKIARPSKSGSFDMARLETTGSRRFYFCPDRLSMAAPARSASASGGWRGRWTLEPAAERGVEGDEVGLLGELGGDQGELGGIVGPRGDEHVLVGVAAALVARLVDVEAGRRRGGQR